MRLIDDIKAALVPALAIGSWSDIERRHQDLGIRWREDLKPGWGKPRYVEKVLAEMSDDEIAALAYRCVETFGDSGALAIQDAIWWLEDGGEAQVSELTRLDIADALDGRTMDPRTSPDELLRRFATPKSEWLLPSVQYGRDGRLYSEPAPLGFESWLSDSGTDSSLQPYSHRELLDSYGFRHWPDQRLFQFLEALVDPRVRREAEQEEWVSMINGLLLPDGFVLHEASRMSGQPVYVVVRRTRGVTGRPKNLIFAANGPKPELGLSDAVNNDVVILKHEEYCLAFEDPITDEGLTWTDLIAWWARRNEVDANEPAVRKELGHRLLESLASPPERLFFTEYFKQFSPRLAQRLPALIPQVYLHYDPLTLRQLTARGEGKRLPAQRMDFLMLLPNRVRIVLEVDGQQHYSRGEGASARPSPEVYAETVAADRILRLAGYEVYRFGGRELSDPRRAAKTVREFITALFRRHELIR